MADGLTKDGLTGLVMADAVAATCVSAGDAPMPSYVAATEAVGSGRAAVRQINILVMPHDDVVLIMMMSPGVVTRAGVMSSVMIMAMGLKEEIVIEQSRVEPWLVVIAHVETRGILRPQRVGLYRWPFDNEWKTWPHEFDEGVDEVFAHSGVRQCHDIFSS